MTRKIKLIAITTDRYGTMEVTLPDSRHFSLQEIGEGIFAAIATDGGWAICNAGIIDLGDKTVVFDTFVNQTVAQELKKAAENLTKKEVHYVVNSHFHSDHVRGNQAFTESEIIATTKTREIMARRKQSLESNLQTTRNELQKELESILSNTSDPDQIRLEGYVRGMMEGLPTLNYKLPTLTFENSTTIYGSKRNLEIVTYGGGHTISDLIVHLSEERIAFLGDLLFVDCIPYLPDGNPKELLRILDKIQALDERILVPGHGPVGTSRDISPMKDYIEHVERTVERVKIGGGTLEDASAKPMVPPFDSWKWRGHNRDNVEFLFNRD